MCGCFPKKTNSPPRTPPDSIANDHKKSQTWAWSQKPRIDLEASTQALGRLNSFRRNNSRDFDIDLSRVYLQGLNLSKSNFDNVKFFHAHLLGTNFVHTTLRNAYLEAADLRWTVLFYANAEGADFTNANMMGSSVIGAKFVGCKFYGTRFDRYTSIMSAEIEYAAFSEVDLSGELSIPAKLATTFGDGTVKLGQYSFRPDHWPKEKLGWNEFDLAWRAWQREQGYAPHAKGE